MDVLCPQNIVFQLYLAQTDPCSSRIDSWRQLFFVKSGSLSSMWQSRPMVDAFEKRKKRGNMKRRSMHTHGWP